MIHSPCIRDMPEIDYTKEQALTRSTALLMQLIEEQSAFVTSLNGVQDRLIEAQNKLIAVSPLGYILREHGTLIASLAETQDQLVAGHRGMVTSSKLNEYLKEREKKLREQGGLFTELFSYHLEHFHSKMLRMILDKNTKDIGDERFLAIFIDVLREKLRERKLMVIEHDFKDMVSVENETKHIDVYVYDETHAIIIENKLNGAEDQRNQLARYVEWVNSQGKEVVAVVYIPLFYKEPPLETYDNYDKEVEEIRQKLVVLSATELSRKFIAPCEECQTAISSSKYILSQYRKVLEIIGGNMASIEVDMKFLEELYKDEQSILIAKNICELWDWNKRETFLGHFLLDIILVKLKDNGFVDDQNPLTGMMGWCKDIKGSGSKLQVCLSRNDKWGLFLGLRYRGEFEENKKNIVFDALCSATISDYFDPGSPGRDNESQNKCHAHKRFYSPKYLCPITDIAAYLLERIEQVERAGEKLLDDGILSSEMPGNETTS
jgi:hypothetical protein